MRITWFVLVGRVFFAAEMSESLDFGWMGCHCCAVGYWCWAVYLKQKPVNLDCSRTDG